MNITKKDTYFANRYLSVQEKSIRVATNMINQKSNKSGYYHIIFDDMCIVVTSWVFLFYVPMLKLQWRIKNQSKYDGLYGLLKGLICKDACR
ncbi:hypothetical protein LU293_04415 [Moraxella nasovis]|uniref:hypothetical protein n=1 Tax=Moraxella nasovis TaxID=2904121 RepID=UPI001F612086|nr:hypothetical protein [Moraxella nasovis]UNU74146.1 hypothetical protein LU293_04415 [Moraxella nasovis]